ncbi:MAG: glycosyl hydrolase family 18 protein [Dehalococcoidia bacterium]|jgi:spore germination protein YaaH
MKRIVFLTFIALLFASSGLVGCSSFPWYKHEIKYLYGFWPYWTDPGSYQPDWSGLTHVSYFSIDATANGGLDTQYIGPAYYYIREKAHSQNVKVTLTVACFDRTAQDSILAYHGDDLVDAIVNKLQDYGADGVCMDFEEVTDTNPLTGGSNTVLMQNLMLLLNNKLKTANPDYHISFCVTGNVENVYRNHALADYTDAVFLMGYEYHWSKAPETGAISPFDDSRQFDVNKSIDMLKKWYPADKLILGLPFYGYDWACASSEPGAKTSGEGDIVTMYSAVTNARGYGRLWDASSHTPWYRYQSESIWHQCWYEDTESLALKFNYVNATNIAGAGFWALGYEGSDSPVWALVKQAFNHK